MMLAEATIATEKEPASKANILVDMAKKKFCLPSECILCASQANY